MSEIIRRLVREEMQRERRRIIDEILGEVKDEKGEVRYFGGTVAIQSSP